MSAETLAAVSCDYFAPEAPTGQKFCDETVASGRQHDDTYVRLTTKAAARKEARSRGWSHLRHPRIRGMSKDYCPAHEDQALAKADEWGVKLTRPKVKQQEGPTP